MESQIPDELWLDIISYVSQDSNRKQHLRQLSQCTKQLHRLCLPEFWRYCCVDINNTIRACELVQLMLNHHYIADAIEHLHIFGTRWGDGDSDASDAIRDNLRTTCDQIPMVFSSWRNEVELGSEEALMSLMVEISRPKDLTVEVRPQQIKWNKFWSPLTQQTLKELDCISVHDSNGHEFPFPASLFGTRSLELRFHPNMMNYPNDFFHHLSKAYSGNIENLQELVVKDAIRPYLDNTAPDLREFVGLRNLNIPISWWMGNGFERCYLNGRSNAEQDVKERMHLLLPPHLQTLTLSLDRRSAGWDVEMLKTAVRHLLKAPVVAESVTSSLESIELMLSETYSTSDRRFHWTTIMESAVNRDPPIQVTMVRIPERLRHSTRQHQSFPRLCDKWGVWHSTALFKEGRFTQSDDPTDTVWWDLDVELICGNAFDCESTEDEEEEEIVYTYARRSSPHSDSSESDADMGF